MQVTSKAGHYTVSAIQAPITAEHISRYAGLRLDALKTDAIAFTATYEDESKFSDDQWRELLEQSGRIPLIAHTGESLLDRDTQWAGVGNLVTPKHLEVLGWDIPLTFLGLPEDTAAYLLEGFWTRPDHRGLGLAGKMLQAVVEMIKADQATEGRKRVLTLQVRPDNKAQTVYTRVGFVNKGIMEDDPIQEDWMVLEIV